MSADLYAQDHVGSAAEPAILLKVKCLEELDVEHLIEELNAIIGNERRELYRRLRVLIAHLLKWQFQSEQRYSSWKGTIRTQRRGRH